MKLIALQQAFYAAVRVDFFISETFLNTIACEKAAQEERLRIYRHSSVGSLQKALASFFPVCKKLVGEVFFDFLTMKYLEKNPLRDFSVFTLQKDFPDFIDEVNQADSVPYLSDMARYELAWQRVFYGPSHEPINFTVLAQTIAQENDQIIFSLPAGCAFFSSSYPLYHIWETCQPEYAGDFSIDFLEGAFNFLFWQEEYRVRVVSLTPSEFAFLRLLETPQPFILQCEKFEELGFEGIDEFLPKLFQWGCVRVVGKCSIKNSW